MKVTTGKQNLLYDNAEIVPKVCVCRQSMIASLNMLKGCEDNVVNLTEDIHPLTEFKRNTANMVRQMKKTRRPLVLTVNGKAELIIQDARSYQLLLERLDRLEAIEAIREGIKDMEEGRVQDARTALESLGTKLGL